MRLRFYEKHVTLMIMLMICSMMNQQSGTLLKSLGVNATIQRYGFENWKWEGNMHGNNKNG